MPCAACHRLRASARPVRISSYLAWRERRDFGAADLRALADRLVREALRAPGEHPLPPGEEAGVSAALAATLHALGDLTLSDVEAVRLGPQAFARQLRADPRPCSSLGAAPDNGGRLARTRARHCAPAVPQRGDPRQVLSGPVRAEKGAARNLSGSGPPLRTAACPRG
ncbi:hypothetical protein [Streptomyces sp. ISL-44]|uniref:NACHT N-terminal Helical domain 1-containing protein n=1 Tax=Streptomyces sp. ISL-44 TaxID=2819184 RepID=UPI0035ABF7E4